MSTDPTSDPVAGPTGSAGEPTHPHGPDHDDPVLDEVEGHVDPAVAEAVHSVRDRFGAAGLRDLITLAGYELDVAQQAMARLRDEVVDDDEPYDQLADEPTASSGPPPSSGMSGPPGPAASSRPSGPSGATTTGDDGAR